MHNHILETQEITALRLKATFGYFITLKLQGILQGLNT